MLCNLCELQDVDQVCCCVDEFEVCVKCLVDQVYCDVLIGVFNCCQLEVVLEQEFLCVGCQGWLLLVVFIDLDDFKKINDVYGYLIGDEVLCVFVGKLQGQLCSSDIVVCFGGEEFVVLLFNISESVVLDVICWVLVNIVVMLMVELEGGLLFVIFFVGVVIQGGYECFVDVQDLLCVVDDVLYCFKNLGCNWVIVCLLGVLGYDELLVMVSVELG